MCSVLWNLMAILGIVCCIMAFIVVMCIVAAPHDRSSEDEEQLNFLKEYFTRKDDNND